MASTSVSGTGSAAPIGAWANSRRIGSAITAGGLLLGAAPSGTLDVAIDGLRSARGEVRVCLTTQREHFPDCNDDPAARRLTVPAGDAASIAFADLPSGNYALALIHDENGNARLDTRLGIPREGFGFSRNPRLLFGPPPFAAARFQIAGGHVDQNIRVRYFL